MQLWEGLGYYSRARNIYKAAQVLADKYKGEFPRDASSVESLPGIGRYTAGAILSIAYNLPVPILEANTVRIHARLLGINAPTESKAIQNILWEAAKQILDKKSPGTINQALMQFGQQVCKKRPLCDQCPISQYCQAKRQGLENSIPIPKIKPKTIFWHHGAVVIYDKQNRIYLRCHLPGEHWAGLWDFPRVDLDSIQTDTKNPVESLVQSQFGLKIRLISPDPFLSIEHAVTNHKISLDCFLGVIQESGKTDKAAEGQVWIPAEKLKDYPLSSTGRKIADKINQIDRIKV